MPSPEGIFESVRQLGTELMRTLAPRLGLSAIMAHLKQVQEILPEVAQATMVRFEASISAAGAVTQPSSVSLPTGYKFELAAISGYIESPGDAVANFPLLTYNIQQQGKRNVFETDQSMSQHLTIVGPAAPIEFKRNLYLFDAGSIIKATFSRSGTWNGNAAKVVGVVLIGGLVAADRR